MQSNLSQRAGVVSDTISNFSVQGVPGALAILYKGREIGYIGIPIFTLVPGLKTWLEASHDKSDDADWKAIVERYAEPTPEAAKVGKTATFQPASAELVERMKRQGWRQSEQPDLFVNDEFPNGVMEILSEDGQDKMRWHKVQASANNANRCAVCRLRLDSKLHAPVLAVAEEYKNKGQEAAEILAKTLMPADIVRWERIAFGDAVRSHSGFPKNATEKKGSTGYECGLIELEPGQWYYALAGREDADWDSPESTFRGPYPTEDACNKGLSDNEANPGGYNIVAYDPKRAASKSWPEFKKMVLEGAAKTKQSDRNRYRLGAAEETPSQRAKRMRDFWQDPKLNHMLEFELELMAPGSNQKAFYRSLIEHKDGKRIRIGYWPITSDRADAKLIRKLYAEYNDPNRYTFYASRDVPAEIEDDPNYAKFASAKVATVNSPDTGEYDLEHEAHVRDEVREWAQYAEESDNTDEIKPFDPAGNYLCGTCDMRQGENECMRVEGPISFEKGSCRLFHLGEPENQPPMKGKFSKEEVKYAESNQGGFGCHRCEYGAEARKADNEGRPSWCSFWGTHVVPNGCCAENELDKKEKSSTDFVKASAIIIPTKEAAVKSDTRMQIAETLLNSQLKFDDEDLEQIADYLNSPQTSEIWDQLDPHIQMFINKLPLDPKTEMRIPKQGGWLMQHLTEDPVLDLPPTMRTDPEGGCPNCGGGLTRRMNTDGTTEYICTKCEYAKKQSSLKVAIGPGEGVSEGPRDIAEQHGDAQQPDFHKEHADGYTWEWNGNEVTLCCPTGCIALEGEEAREFTQDMVNFAEAIPDEDALLEKVNQLIQKWFSEKAKTK